MERVVIISSEAFESEQHRELFPTGWRHYMILKLDGSCDTIVSFASTPHLLEEPFEIRAVLCKPGSVTLSLTVWKDLSDWGRGWFITQCAKQSAISSIKFFGYWRLLTRCVHAPLYLSACVCVSLYLIHSKNSFHKTCYIVRIICSLWSLNHRLPNKKCCLRVGG